MTWDYSAMTAFENSFRVWMYIQVEYCGTIVLPASFYENGSNDYDPILGLLVFYQLLL